MRLAILALLVAGPAFAQDVVTQPAVKTDAKSGAQVYRQLCRQCHGPNMVNSGTSSYDLRRFPEDQPERFSTSVLNGKNSMPAWKGTITPEELDKLWEYVRSHGQS